MKSMTNLLRNSSLLCVISIKEFIEEQNVFLENLMSLSFDCRRNEVKLKRLEQKLEKEEDPLKKELYQIFDIAPCTTASMIFLKRMDTQHVNKIILAPMSFVQKPRLVWIQPIPFSFVHIIIKSYFLGYLNH